MNHEKPSKLNPVLVGGAALGVASGIPLLGALNCACCALVVGGGVLASYLYIRNLPAGMAVTYGDGALLGVLAGLVGAVVTVIVSIPFQLLTSQMGGQFMQQALEDLRNEPDIPPEFVRLMEGLLSPEGIGAAGILLGLIFYAIIFPIFAALGGILGVAMFQKSPPVTPPGGASGYTPPPPPAAPTPPPAGGV